MDACIRDVLIGQQFKVISATNPSLIGVEGLVVDETKNTLVVKTSRCVKTLLKTEVELWLPHVSKKIVGCSIKKRPEDRLKR